MQYIRLSKNKNNNQLIPANESPYKFIKNFDEDWYISMLSYNQEQYEQWKRLKSLAGMKHSKTSKLWFDFDGSDVTGASVEEALVDARILCKRLQEHGASEENMQICFSGNKGVGIILDTNELFTCEEVKTICKNLAGDLKSFDTKMYDNQRIFRLPFTKNEKSGLYKIPLSLDDLNTLSLNEIKQNAKSIEDYDIEGTTQYYKQYKVPQSILKFKNLVSIKKEQPIMNVITSNEVDFTKKPKFLTNCRWALQNGLFRSKENKTPGERSSVLLCLASTYKNLGFEIDHTYRILKGVCELQSKRNNQERFPDEELYNNICMQVYSTTWNNGQFSCRTEGSWLREYCETLGQHSCQKNKETFENPHTLIQVAPTFKDYVKNIDKNTIITGIKSLDERIFISTGANVGIIGAAGSGKSSIALDILNNTSKAGVKSVFASLDMNRTRMFEKVMYRLTGLDRKNLYKLYQDDKEAETLKKLEEEFGNVFFFNKSSPSVQDIKDYVLDCQEASGEKIKLVMVDYFERVSSDFSDDTQASKRVAGELQDLVNDLDIALITLVQPNKHAISGGADQPIYDYTKIKGSSFVYQAFRIIISLWRPFYNPKDFSQDHYMQMAVLKNDLGELSEFALGWNGKQGRTSELEDFQKDELEQLLKEKMQKKESKNDGWD